MLKQRPGISTILTICSSALAAHSCSVAHRTIYTLLNRRFFTLELCRACCLTFIKPTLNFLTPHQKWGIHSTYSDNLLMLTLGRGGPVVWLSEADAKDLGIADNDWIEVFNSNGALTARAVVSQRVPAGMTMMYHAQERIVNLPGSEITQQRGGIHNSVTRITPKPTHMIGGYAHLAYGFNYYGTVGSNRDEFVVVRKMKNIDWLDGEGNDQVQESVK